MATGKVIIQGENKLGSAVKSAKGDLTSFEKATSNLGATLKKAFAITAIIAGIKKLGDVCVSAFNEFENTNRAYAQLSFSLKNNDGFTSVISNIEKLSRQTLIGKGDIERMVSELAGLGKSSEEINKISDAAVALSNVTGKDLHSSMTTLLSTYNGTTTQLKKLGIDTSSLTQIELEQGKAIDFVISKFQKLSKEMATDSSSQAITNIKNNIGDIKQQIGGIVNYNIKPLLINMDLALNNTKERIIEVINYIGAVIKNFPQVFSRTLTLLYDMFKRTFEWESLKSIFISIFENLTILTQAYLKGVFITLPKILWNLAKGIGFYIAYLGVKIKDELLLTIQSVINSAGEKLKNTWIGKTFGFGEKFENVSFNITGEKAESIKSKADLSFENIAPIVSDSIKDCISAITVVSKNTTDVISNLYGDLTEDFKEDITTIITPELVKITKAADVTSHYVDENTQEIKEINNELKKPTILQAIQNKIGELFGMFISSTSKEQSAFGTSVFSSFTSSLKDTGSFINSLLNNMSEMGIALGGIATAFTILADGFGSVISEVLNIVFNVVLQPLKVFGQIIGELIVPILENVVVLLEPLINSLSLLFESFSFILEPIFNFVANVILFLQPLFIFLSDIITRVGIILQPIAVILQTVFVPILSIIGTILQALTPILQMIEILFDVLSLILKAFAYIVVTITGTIAYLAQWIAHIFASAYNILFGWLFGRIDDPGSPGSYSSYMGEKYAQIDSAFETTGTDSSSLSSSTDTAVTSASYQGGTTITINIYQQAPVVGTGGMREFAQMIKNEFLQMEYYGQTA